VRTYGHTAVPADDRDGNGRSKGEVSQLLGDKGGSTDNIQGGDTKEPEMRISSVGRSFM